MKMNNLNILCVFMNKRFSPTSVTKYLGASLLLLSSVLNLMACAPSPKEINTLPKSNQLELTNTKVDAWRYDALNNQIYLQNSQNKSFIIVDVETYSEKEHIFNEIHELGLFDLSPDNKTLAISYTIDEETFVALIDNDLENFNPQLGSSIPGTINGLLLGNDHAAYINVEDNVSKIDFNITPPVISNLDIPASNIISLNRNGTNLYTIAKEVSPDTTTLWDINQDTPSQISSKSFFGAGSIEHPRLVSSVKNDFLFAFSDGGHLSFDGKVEIINRSTLNKVGNLQVAGQVNALAISHDGSRALVTHNDNPVNRSPSNAYHPAIHDVHVFDLRNLDFPELGSYELPGEASPDGLIATKDNQIVARINDGENTKLVFLAP